MDHADLSSPITLIEPLTDRELDVLRLMAEDLSTQEMAERLLSPATANAPRGRSAEAGCSGTRPATPPNRHGDEQVMGSMIHHGAVD
jgi:hypothetical protein